MKAFLAERNLLRFYYTWLNGINSTEIKTLWGGHQLICLCLKLQNQICWPSITFTSTIWEKDDLGHAQPIKRPISLSQHCGTCHPNLCIIANFNVFSDFKKLYICNSKFSRILVIIFEKVHRSLYLKKVNVNNQRNQQVF